MPASAARSNRNDKARLQADFAAQPLRAHPQDHGARDDQRDGARLPAPASCPDRVRSSCHASSRRRPCRPSWKTRFRRRWPAVLACSTQVVAAHTALEAFQIGIDPGHLVRGPGRDLVEVVKAQLVAQLFHLRADALDLFQVVRLAAARRASAWRAWCLRTCPRPCRRRHDRHHQRRALAAGLGAGVPPVCGAGLPPDLRRLAPPVSASACRRPAGAALAAGCRRAMAGRPGPGPRGRCR